MAGGRPNSGMSTLRSRIGQAGASHERLARQVLRNPAPLPELIAGIQSDQARVKFGCAKVLRLIAERRPELLYDRFDFFAGLLGHNNKILQWEGLIVLSHLAWVDSENKFAGIFERYFAPITGPVMITAANAIGGAARVALAKPWWADQIAAAVLQVARARYATPECRNVAIGHAIKALDQFFGLLEHPKPVRRFVRKQLQNPRPATRKKAEAFLKKHRRSPSRV
jgi:hypothetical protein